jgi:hypothetical protein
MMRLMTAVMGVVTAELALGAELKPIHTQKTKDVIVTLVSESGQWRPGKNDFVLELTSAKDRQAIDAGKVTLNTSMTMPGMAPMIAGATLSPDKTPGRYVGTISFADGGTRQVTVTWDGPAGKGSTRFSLSVR